MVSLDLPLYEILSSHIWLNAQSEPDNGERVPPDLFITPMSNEARRKWSLFKQINVEWVEKNIDYTLEWFWIIKIA